MFFYFLRASKMENDFILKWLTAIFLVYLITHLKIETGKLSFSFLMPSKNEETKPDFEGLWALQRTKNLSHALQRQRPGCPKLSVMPLLSNCTSSIPRHPCPDPQASVFVKVKRPPSSRQRQVEVEVRLSAVAAPGWGAAVIKAPDWTWTRNARLPVPLSPWHCYRTGLTDNALNVSLPGFECPFKTVRYRMRRRTVLLLFFFMLTGQRQVLLYGRCNCLYSLSVPPSCLCSYGTLFKHKE